MALYRDRRQKVRIEPTSIFIDDKNFTNTTKIPSEKINKLFDLISIPIEKFKEEMDILLNMKDEIGIMIYPTFAQKGEKVNICFQELIIRILFNYFIAIEKIYD